MSAPSKIKWFASIIMAGTLLFLALMGGNWGTSYSASASVYVAPFIASMDPSAVLAGSANTPLIINGSNFGTGTDTRVRLAGDGIDLLLIPLEITSDQIRVIVPAYLLVEPIIYTLTVIKSIGGTIPTIPTIPNPPGEEISNPVPFTVYGPFTYLPIITKNATH
jgi:hypothetical protein